MLQSHHGIVAAMRIRLRSQIFQNVLANYFTVAWAGGLSILLIPWYLRLLGAHEWGVVAVCMALQAIFGLLDAGLSQIMPRDVARVAADPVEVRRVYRLFSQAYGLIAVLGFAVGQLAIPWLLTHWLNLEPAQQVGAELPLRLVLLQFLFQFANSAHIGYWNGIQNQAQASIRQSIFITLKHATALILLSFWKPEAWVYILSFSVVALIEWLLNHLSIRVGDLREVRTSVRDVRRLLNEIGLLVVSVMVGLAATQMDRIFLVQSLDVATFGRYVIVLNLGLAFMQLQYPLMRAYVPRLVASEGAAVSKGNGKLWAALFVLCVLPCLCAGIITPWLLRNWLHDSLIVEQCTLPLRLILSAVAINAIYQLIYQSLLISGRSAVILRINIACLIAIAAFLYVAVPRYGVVAGGLSWVLLAVLQLIGGAWCLRMPTPAKPSV